MFSSEQEESFPHNLYIVLDLVNCWWGYVPIFIISGLSFCSVGCGTGERLQCPTLSVI